MTEARTAGRSAPDARFRDLPSDATSLPAVPPEFDSTLDAGVALLGLTLSAGARAAIDTHVRLLLAWNAAINLTSVTDPAAVASRHVVDSLAAVPLLRAWSDRLTGPVRPLAIVDLGSGAGFPGLPIAAALPGAHVTLVDSIGKKVAFLEVACRAMGFAARTAPVAARGEGLALHPRRWDVVTARAVATLAELVELALPLLRDGGRLLAWKRGDLAAELEAASRAARSLGGGMPVVHGLPPELTDLAGHVLVEVRKDRPTPPAYPRDPGQRRRQPW
jgi:16S rRNA (guanine527-N7)-methyltransferase